MGNWLLAAAGMNVTWYVIPLAAVISLVYSASRYEKTDVILRRSARLFVIIIVCMAVLLAVLLLLSSGL